MHQMFICRKKHWCKVLFSIWRIIWYMLGQLTSWWGGEAVKSHRPSATLVHMLYRKVSRSGDNMLGDYRRQRTKDSCSVKPPPPGTRTKAGEWRRLKVTRPEWHSNTGIYKFIIETNAIELSALNSTRYKEVKQASTLHRTWHFPHNS